MNICIIEDDPATRMLLKALVNSGQAVKHTVLECVSGEDAIAKINAPGNPTMDVFLVDLDLPGISGLEVISRLRTDCGTASEFFPYIMMVTAHEPGDALAPALSAGANDYLTKPVNAKVLQTRLKVAQSLIGHAHMNAQSEYAKAILAYTAGQLNCQLAIVELGDESTPLKVSLANANLLADFPQLEQHSLSQTLEWTDSFSKEVQNTLLSGTAYHGGLQSSHSRYNRAPHMLRAFPSGNIPCSHALILIEQLS